MEVTAWIDSLKGDVAEVCAGLGGLAPESRLRAVAELREALEAVVTGRALDGSMAAARAEGWGLRRIGEAAGLSHETVRGRLAGADERGRPR
ncbi:hypothetical protein [Streptomyces sp. NBC_00539]|uniref:hypothetical protein n=1 Tax=Streptomyces sp. NBC_00539 TaxID=2975770 RepID=UPI002E81F068|nr:hypothetical protein [Streptomyces sp. NBC_00539]WUC62778.1 hypothetical protein OG861_00255 [Streptomyces sp. NBC_00539]